MKAMCYKLVLLSIDMLLFGLFDPLMVIVKVL